MICPKCHRAVVVADMLAVCLECHWIGGRDDNRVGATDDERGVADHGGDNRPFRLAGDLGQPDTVEEKRETGPAT